jgi:hypothetical protein
VLAAVFSLGLALAVWLRPEWGLLLALVAAAMVVFAALMCARWCTRSMRDNGGLAVLVAVVAALHYAAAGVALSMGRAAALAPREPLV